MRAAMNGALLVSLGAASLACFGGSGDGTGSQAGSAATAERPVAREGDAADPSAAADPPGALDALEGHWGFISTMEGGRCAPLTRKLREAMAGNGAACRSDAGRDLFGIRDQPHHRCSVGDHEWLVFETEALCTEMAAVHDSHGP
jgi:hypothetical protein